MGSSAECPHRPRRHHGRLEHDVEQATSGEDVPADHCLFLSCELVEAGWRDHLWWSLYPRGDVFCPDAFEEELAIVAIAGEVADAIERFVDEKGYVGDLNTECRRMAEFIRTGAAQGSGTWFCL